ncbi:hypothetical protein [Sporosarcina sp. NPDC096371]
MNKEGEMNMVVLSQRIEGINRARSLAMIDMLMVNYTIITEAGGMDLIG